MKNHLLTVATFIITVIGVFTLVTEKEVSAIHYGILLLGPIFLFSCVVKDALEFIFSSRQNRKKHQEEAAALQKEAAVIRNKEIYAPQQVFTPPPIQRVAEKPRLSVPPPPKKREDTVSYVKRDETIQYSTIPVMPVIIPVDIGSSEPSNDYSTSSTSDSSDFSGGGGDFGGGGADGSWD
jgi:uncharacterized membrane protein YgcG